MPTSYSRRFSDCTRRASSKDWVSVWLVSRRSYVVTVDGFGPKGKLTKAPHSISRCMAARRHIMDITSKTVLLAEDDPNDEELFLLAIERANIDCHIDIVRDGEELVNYLFAMGRYQYRDVNDTPDWVLLDLKMPKISGLQVLTVLGNTHGRPQMEVPPIVVFTSSDDEHDKRSSYELGAMSFVRKPASHRHFVEVVQQTVLYWLMVNEPLKGRAGPMLPESVS